MNRLNDTFRELGFGTGVLYLLARLLKAAGIHLYCYRFVAQPVQARPRRELRSSGTRIAPAASLAELPHPRPRPDTVLARRFANGARCIAATRGGQLSGFLWYQCGAYDEDEVRARYCLGSGQLAWDFDVFVQPPLRAGLTFGRMWEEAHRQLDAAGVRWTCSRISPFNPASLRSHARLGARNIGSAVFLCAGRAQAMAGTLPPYLHFSLSSPVELNFDASVLTQEPPCATTSC
jgi:hypothetical protein